MRDRTNAARAFLRSEAYRRAREDAEVPPAGAARGAPRRDNRRSALSRGGRSGGSSGFTALALLGLLDLLT